MSFDNLKHTSKSLFLLNSNNDIINVLTIAEQFNSNKEEKPIIKKNCEICGKKLGLLPVKCKCGLYTCSIHRYPKHDCNFDYKKEHVKRLKKDNPKVAPEKIEYI